jgi:hypothetical protein
MQFQSYNISMQFFVCVNWKCFLGFNSYGYLHWQYSVGISMLFLEFILPHSASSWIFSPAENLANLSMQDRATKWHYCRRPQNIKSGISQHWLIQCEFKLISQQHLNQSSSQSKLKLRWQIKIDNCSQWRWKPMEGDLKISTATTDLIFLKL